MLYVENKVITDCKTYFFRKLCNIGSVLVMRILYSHGTELAPFLYDLLHNVTEINILVKKRFICVNIRISCYTDNALVRYLIITENLTRKKQDKLLGLKENVIIGKLIPAGTGLGKYRAIEVVDEGKEEEVVITPPTAEAPDDEIVYSTEAIAEAASDADDPCNSDIIA